MGRPTAEQTALIIETTSEAIANNQPKEQSWVTDVYVGVAVALIVTLIGWLWKRK